MVFLLKDEPKWSFSTWGNSQSYGLITPLRMSYEDSYAKAFPFDKIIDGMLDPEMIEDTVKIVNEAIKDKIQVNLIITTAPAATPPLIAQKIGDRLHSEKQQRLF